MTRKPVPMDKPGQAGPRQFGPPPTSQELAQAAVVEKVEKVKEKKPKRKNDPKLVAAARELRDKWLEQVNAPGGERLLASSGKYDVSRMIGEASVEMPRVKQIAA